MPLDPNDPLIPMPWQMDDIRKYRAAQQFEAARKQLQYEKDVMDVQERMRKTPEGRITEAEELSKRAQEIRQKREGIPFGDVARDVALGQDKNLLEASKAQGAYDIEQAGMKGRLAGIEAQLMGSKALVPTATVSMGGVKQQVLPEQAGETSKNIYGQIYRSQVPQLADTYMAEGFDRDTAIRMASADIRKELVKASTGGKVVLTSNDGMSTISYSNEQAQKMWKDPSTPKFIKTQLNNFFGESEQPNAGSWIKTRLGK